MTEEEKGTNGLSSQDIYEIKEAFYGKKWGAGFIADDMGFTFGQVLYAINLNEETPIEFDENDFKV